MWVTAICWHCLVLICYLLSTLSTSYHNSGRKKNVLRFVSVVVIDIKSRNTHSHERQPLHVDVQPGSCQFKSIVQLFLKTRLTFSSKGKVMSATYFMFVCRGFVYATVVLNRRKFTSCFIQFSLTLPMTVQRMIVDDVTNSTFCKTLCICCHVVNCR